MNNIEKMNAPDVERLVEACQAGDRSAFDRIVMMHQQVAMQVAVRIIGNADGACEAVQEAFVKAFLKIDKLRDSKKFKTWFLQIVANTAISQRRMVHRRMELVSISDCNDVEDKIFFPPDKSESQELQEAIRKAMLKLSKKEAMAISLIGTQGLSHVEAAKIMDCSAGVVRWHMFNARHKLKVLLKEYL